MISKKIIIANWKMNGNLTLLNEFHNKLIHITEDIEFILALPSIMIKDGQELFKNKNNINIGAQNFHHEASGAYTGNISTAMLREYNCKYSIIGHCESRLQNNESNENILAKINLALANEITPIVCVGEKELGNYDEFMEQCKILLPYSKEIVIAYEPVYAIGTGYVPDYESIERGISIIHRFNRKSSIIYGGSVNIDNANSIIEDHRFIDGLLIGGASLKVDILNQILDDIE